MEILVIGKPAVNVYLPLQEFPNEGDIFTIKEKIESVGSVGATAACLLADWKMSVHYTGVVGNDPYAEKIRDTFNEHGVNQKHVEINFTKPTASNFMFINSKTGTTTKVVVQDPENLLTKYKYDFLMDYCIMDGSDGAGSTAFLNNNTAGVKTLFYASVPSHENIVNAKRSTHVVCTQTFAEGLTKTKLEDNVEAYIDFYQKIVDTAGSSNYIVILNNHKILYSVDSKVKMLPEMTMNNVDTSSFDSIFLGTIAFGLINNIPIDDTIKLANTAGALSIAKIGEVSAIPKFDDVIDNCGLRQKLGMGTYKEQQEYAAQQAALQNGQAVQAAAPQPQAVAQPVAQPAAVAPVVEQPQVNAFETQPVAQAVAQPVAQPVATPVAPVQQVVVAPVAPAPVDTTQNV